MRIRLLIPFAAALALCACGEQPTPKPPLPSKVTAPIAPAAAPPATVPAAAPAAVCPPQPAPVCPPPVVKKTKVSTGPAVHRKVRKHKAKRAVAHAPTHHYRRYTGPSLERGYAERGETRRKHHRHHRSDEERGYATGSADHYHAYGPSGAVTHFAQREDRYDEGYDGRVEDRYSAGGRSYERYERQDSYSYDERDGRGYAERGEHGAYRGGGYGEDRTHGYSSGGSSSYSYSERSSESGRASSSYSESYADHGGYRRVETGAGGCCRPAEAAGRDAYGFLTWPGKVPAAPY